MIPISRRTLHEFRSIASQALNLGRGSRPPLLLEPCQQQRRLRVGSPQAAVQRELPDDGNQQRIVLPFELLADCQAKRDAPVTLALEDDRVLAQWQEGRIPQLVRYQQPAPPEGLPALPTSLAENPPGILQALADACAVAAAEPTRYALHCVQLDGQQGSIAASDGRQVLLQRGFEFPWQGAVLLPARKAFACPHLPRDERVGIGCSEDWLALRVGPWTLQFRLQVDGRFPRLEDCIPADAAAMTTLQISAGDAAFLLDHLQRLPVVDPAYLPVTLDLNGAVVIRAGGADKQPVTELALVDSTTAGDAVRIHTNRHYLARALALGFRQIRFVSAEQPAFCRDASRDYAWAPLGAAGAIGPHPKHHRIESPHRPASQAATRSRRSRRGAVPMTDAPSPTKGEGRKTHDPPAVGEIETSSSIGQAEALRDSLKEALDKTRELIRALKAQRKAARIVENTLASLRQLQHVDR